LGAWAENPRGSCLGLPRTVVAAGLSAIAIGASGCSGDSDVEAEGPPAATTKQVATQLPTQSTVDISKFRAAFKESYGTPPDERPWYDHITAMRIFTENASYRVLEVRTNLERVSNTVLSEICEVGFAVASETGNGQRRFSDPLRRWRRRVRVTLAREPAFTY